MNYTNKSFSVQMRRGESPADLDERWKQTFGERPVKQPPAVLIPDPPQPPAYPVMVNGCLMVPLTDVVALLDREAQKARENGDRTTAEVWELARAKMRVFER